MATSDPEEKKLLSDAEEVANMLQSRGWGYVREKLDARILDLQNIHNIDMTKVDTLSVQLAARVLAVEQIVGWLKADVYGFVEQQVGNANKPKRKEDPIFDRQGE